MFFMFKSNKLLVNNINILKGYNNMSIENFGLGRVEKEDVRDLNYPLSAWLPEKTFIDQKNWWNNGWWGNQGKTSCCVIYSWSHWIEDGPVIQDDIPNRSKPMLDISKFYHKCQLNDNIPGENYNGTTVRAGAKILQKLGIIQEYRWAASIDDMIKCLLTIGPMVVGTRWYSNMFHPSHEGIITTTGSFAGGHAYLINGVNINKNLFRIKNSWGKSWGIEGQAFISFDDFDKLLKSGGEACMALENKITSVPNIDSISNIPNSL
jgi:hypothetical protein